MTSTLINNVFNPGVYNNYLIAGNITNAFAIGDIGSLDDFFIVGIEPSDESCYPLISGNILDSEGNTLFRLVKNILGFNPGNCSKIVGDMLGYEIHDSAGKLIFKIETKFETHNNLNEDCFITKIKANFYNKKGELVFYANSGESDERIESNTNSVFGFSGGGFGIVQGYKPEDREFLRYIFLSQAKINQPIRGLFEKQELKLDGKALQNATIKNCKLFVTEGDFILIGDNNKFDNCEFVFEGQARQLFDIIKALGPR